MNLCAFFRVDDGPDCPIDRACDQRVRQVPGVEIVLTWKPTRPEAEDNDANP